MTDITGATPEEQNYAEPLPASPVDGSPAATPPTFFEQLDEVKDIAKEANTQVEETGGEAGQNAPDPTSAIPTDISTPTEDGNVVQTGTDASESFESSSNSEPSTPMSLPTPSSTQSTSGIAMGYSSYDPSEDEQYPNQTPETSDIPISEGLSSIPTPTTSETSSESNTTEPVTYEELPESTPSLTEASLSSSNQLTENTVVPDGIEVQLVSDPYPITQEEIEHRFGFHKATIEGPENTQDIHAELRRNFKGFVSGLNRRMPRGREASLALTALEEASMWAHKAIASKAPLQEDDPEPISDELSTARVELATLKALQKEALVNPYVHDQLASLGLI